MHSQRRTFGTIRRRKTYAELDVGSEEVNTLVGEEGALNESGGDDTLLAVQTAEEGVGELGTGVSHRQGRASSTILGLDDLVTTELDAVNELSVDLARDGLAVGILGEEGDDGRAAVATDDGDGSLRGLDSGDTGEEAGGTDDIEGGDAEEVAGLEDASLFESSGNDGDGGVDGVGDDEDVSIWRHAADGGGEVTNDGCVGLKFNKINRKLTGYQFVR